MANVAERREQRSAAQWREIVERQRDSGVTREAFCEAEGIGFQTFRRWESRLTGRRRTAPAQKSEARAVRFAEVAVAAEPRSDSQPPGGWDVELELGGGVCLRIRRGGAC